MLLKKTNTVAFRLGLPAMLVFAGLLPSAAARAQAEAEAENPFCSNCAQTRQFFKQLCDYVADRRAQTPAIYIGGYYMRSLVMGYEVFGEKRYLQTAIDYADGLLANQSPRGYWGTGYGNIYLADTGSALGLLITLEPHVDALRKEKYLQAVQRYVDAIQADGLIHPSGAVGTGWRTDRQGNITGPYRDEYTISSGLTGGEVFAWMYHKTKKQEYLRIANNALLWIMGTMRDDGVIPYVLAGEGASLAKQGDAKNDAALWQRWPYNTSTYVGEGIIFFDRYCDRPEWKAEIRKRIAPHIEFLLRTQNEDGTWAVPDSPDQWRSPGVVNLLVWYYRNVNRDPRIPAAVRRFDRFLLSSEQAETFKLLAPDAVSGRDDTLRAITGRAIGAILVPAFEEQQKCQVRGT